MASRAKRGVICIRKLLWTLAELSPTLFYRLFYYQIQFMLTYDAEVWVLWQTTAQLKECIICLQLNDCLMLVQEHLVHWFIEKRGDALFM